MSLASAIMAMKPRNVLYGKPALDLQFVNGSLVDTVAGVQLTASGGANGTKTTPQGGVVAANAARFNCGPVRTNLLPFSSDLSHSSWAVSPGNVKTVGQRDSAGTDGAALVTINAGDGFEQFAQTLAVATATTLTYTIEAKYVSGNASRNFLLRNSTSATNFDGCTVNLQTGAGGGTGWTVTSLAGGWYRMTYTRSTGISIGDTMAVYGGATGAVGPAAAQWLVGRPQLEPGTASTAFIGGVTASAAYAADPAGLLIEEARTNSWFPSVYSAGNWTLTTAAASTANAAIAPDGTLTAMALIPDNAANGFTAKSAAHTAGVTYTHSAFLKQKAGFTQWLLLAPSGYFSDAANRVATFNLTGSGSVASTAGTGASAKITPYADGWYRCELTYTPDLTATAGLQIRSSSAGNGTNGVYVWGVQWEVGSFATSYIPTTSGAVTRSADADPVTGIASLLSTTSGTLLVEFDTAALTPNASKIIAQLRGATTADAVQLWVWNGASSTVLATVYVGAVNKGEAATAGLTAGATHRAALSYSAARIAGCVDGGAVTGSVVSALPAALTTLDIGAQGSSQLNGHVRRVRYWPSTLTDAALQALTA